MEKAFILGLALGMVGGAVVVANNYKARKMVLNSQEDILKKIDSLAKEREQTKEEKAE